MIFNLLCFWRFCVLFIWFIKSFAETNNIAIDCRNCSAEEILRLLLDTYPSLYDRANRKLVYVGAKCDVEERLRKHNVDIDDVIDSVNEMMALFKRPIIINTNNSVSHFCKTSSCN